MTTAGWIIMIGAISGMTGLLSWCIYKVFSTPGSAEHVHSPVDIDTGETDD
ncbi:MAG: hypothetical protein H7A43_09695 [Verrucomicrobia bacterium]|nr:hypothetical protein [Kiritimatiellia bacterium]MCB1102742.1 hypothetical protein [Kiritimatiellia bacterium]MCP5488909.1 hypothetical protein [Verrucomicrobiota bacterium]